jgi:hypothetical protein
MPLILPISAPSALDPGKDRIPSTGFLSVFSPRRSPLLRVFAVKKTVLKGRF